MAQEDIKDSEDQQEQQPDYIKQLATLGGAKPGKPTSVSDSLNTLTGNQDLMDAQKARNSMQLLSMLGRAGSTAGAALAPLATVKPTDAFFNALDKTAEQPVADVQERQQMAQQKAKTAMVQAGLKNELAKEDSESEISKVGREIAKKAAESAKLDLNIPDNISMSNLEKIMPGIENMANRRLQQDTLLRSKQVGAEGKGQDKEDRALAQTKTILESARGNPEVMQALKDRYAATKAEKLIQSEYDPNKLTGEQVQLIISEVSKIATGGVPSTTEMKALSPETLKSKFGSLYGKLMNEPTPANAGAFIKKYESYLKTLKGDAQNVIDDKIGRVIESSKKQLGESNYNALKEQYVRGQESKEEPSKMSAEDKEAIDWANKNKDDPRAKKILEMHGM